MTVITGPAATASMTKVDVPAMSSAETAPAEWKGVLPRQKVALIQSSYTEVDEKIGALGFGKEFYTVLFEMAPQAQALFKIKRETQEKMFSDVLTMLVKNIDDTGKVVPALHVLAVRHIRYGVQEAHFPVVGAGLLATLERVLGPSFTAPVKEAWTELWGITTKVMWGKMESVRLEKAQK